MFGICRIHRHFNLGPMECVVTSKAATGYISQVKPYSSEFIPWQWKYSIVDKKWLPLEFVEIPADFITNSLELQTDLAEFVTRELTQIQGTEAFEQFGISLDLCKLFKDPLYNIDVILNEETDPTERIQWSKFEPIAGVKSEKTSVTHWH